MSAPHRDSHPRPAARVRLRPLLALALLALALPAAAGKLYQWKDARGVTHYSDAPPPAGADYTNRAISQRGAAGTEQPDAATAAPVANPACTTARANLTLLDGQGPVGIDTDGDGKADSEMDPAQRAAQRQLAEAAIAVHCTPATAADAD